jgi:hypothetical protein
MATQVMKLWRPMSAGPRIRAATIETTRMYRVGSVRARAFHTPPISTVEPLGDGVSAASPPTPPWLRRSTDPTDG